MPVISRSIKLFGTRITGPSGHFERTLRRRDATKDEQKNPKVISMDLVCNMMLKIK